MESPSIRDFGVRRHIPAEKPTNDVDHLAVEEPLEIRGPVISITDRPGLGVEVDWSVVEAHRCPGL